MVGCDGVLQIFSQSPDCFALADQNFENMHSNTIVTTIVTIYWGETPAPTEF
jgi:hypothetical protein